MKGVADALLTELRLPVSIPNPPRAQFIAKSSTNPIQETRALTATWARQLMGLPGGRRDALPRPGHPGLTGGKLRSSAIQFLGDASANFRF